MYEEVRELHAALVEAAAVHDAVAAECADVAQQLESCGDTLRAETMRGVGRGMRINALQMSAEACALTARYPHVLAAEAGWGSSLGRGSMKPR
ncbi:hypothetical protein [Methylobacterium sp. WSM2598]|uniref:hypothetical protein n=1 Tax=Methylobacterium sp. WSM2598 TaxID=398261 RepID=UPI000A05B9E0|nr:hypothetical protein [Methylobacterium sp. WSM2598]